MSETEPAPLRKKLTELRVVDLKIALEKRGIDKTGNKTGLLQRLSKALQDEGKDPDTIDMTEEFSKPAVKRPLRIEHVKAPTRSFVWWPNSDADNKSCVNDCGPSQETRHASPRSPIPWISSQGKGRDTISGADVSQDEGNPDNEDYDEKMEGTKSVQREINKDEDILGENIAKKSYIQENKNFFQRAKVSHGLVAQTTKLESALMTGATDKLKAPHLLQTTDNNTLISSGKVFVKQEYIEPEDVNSTNEEQGSLAATEITATNIKSENVSSMGDLKIKQERTEANYSSENIEQTKTPKINISSNTTNKSSETPTHNQSSKTETPPCSANVRCEDCRYIFGGNLPNYVIAAEENVRQRHVVCNGKNLWVTGIDGFRTRAVELKAHFSKYNCKVISAKIVTNIKTLTKQFFGFITMATTEDAQKCIRIFDRTEFHGRTIFVEMTSRSEFPVPVKKPPIISNQNEEKKDEVKEISEVHKGNEGPHTKTEVIIKQEEIPTVPVIKQEIVEENPIAPAVEESSGNQETNGEVVQEVCKVPEIKCEVEEKEENDGLTSAEPVSEGTEEKSASDKKDAEYSKERDVRSRDRFREKKRSHRSRSKSREYVIRESRPDAFFRPRGFGPRSYGPRRPFMPSHMFIEDKFHHGRFHRDVERYPDSRRFDDRRAREIARRNREESFKIEEERERLRIEKEKLERMRAEVLRKEREQQRIERERLEQERAELRKRSQLTEIDEQHGLKRPFEGGAEKDYYWEERKRIPIPPEPGAELPRRYGEFPHPRSYPERRVGRFEVRPKPEVSPDFGEPSRREGHLETEEHPFPHANRHHDAPEGKPRERPLERPHGQRGNFDRLHQWDGVHNDRPPNKFGPLPIPVGGSQWGSVQKDNWGRMEGQLPPPGVLPERWSGIEYPRGQPPVNLNHPPSMGPPAQLHPMYGSAGNELLGGNIPGNFPGARFNAVRRF